MFLKNKQTGATVEVLDPEALIDPLKSSIKGRVQEGQEEQDPEEFSKSNLKFPSDEDLPRCWLDPNYRSQL
jgi:hypothetical protein